MSFEWLVYAALSGLAVMAMLEKKMHWIGRVIAALVAVGFGYNAAIALFNPEAWLSLIAIAMAVIATFWVRRDRDSSSSKDEE